MNIKLEEFIAESKKLQDTQKEKIEKTETYFKKIDDEFESIKSKIENDKDNKFENTSEVLSHLEKWCNYFINALNIYKLTPNVIITPDNIKQIAEQFSTRQVCFEYTNKKIILRKIACSKQYAFNDFVQDNINLDKLILLLKNSPIQMGSTLESLLKLHLATKRKKIKTILQDLDKEVNKLLTKLSEVTYKLSDQNICDVKEFLSSINSKIQEFHKIKSTNPNKELVEKFSEDLILFKEQYVKLTTSEEPNYDQLYSESQNKEIIEAIFKSDEFNDVTNIIGINIFRMLVIHSSNKEFLEFIDNNLQEFIEFVKDKFSETNLAILDKDFIIALFQLSQENKLSDEDIKALKDFIKISPKDEIFSKKHFEEYNIQIAIKYFNIHHPVQEISKPIIKFFAERYKLQISEINKKVKEFKDLEKDLKYFKSEQSLNNKELIIQRFNNNITDKQKEIATLKNSPIIKDKDILIKIVTDQNFGKTLFAQKIQEKLSNGENIEQDLHKFFEYIFKNVTSNITSEELVTLIDNYEKIILEPENIFDENDFNNTAEVTAHDPNEIEITTTGEAGPF